LQYIPAKFNLKMSHSVALSGFMPEAIGAFHPPCCQAAKFVGEYDMMLDNGVCGDKRLQR
jgi:hypothetical protein